MSGAGRGTSWKIALCGCRSFPWLDIFAGVASKVVTCSTEADKEERGLCVGFFHVYAALCMQAGINGAQMFLAVV